MNANEMSTPHQGAAVSNRRPASREGRVSNRPPSMTATEALLPSLISPRPRQLRFFPLRGRVFGGGWKHAAPCFLLLAFASISFAGPRTSGNYSVTTDSADSGGARATSAAYTNDGSAGGVTGLSTFASPSETLRSGYIGQLYDITGLVVNAASPSVNETATLQLAAWQLLDDTSLLAVPAASVTWGVQSGPVTGISTAGLATAGTVYQNTPATVQGSLGGFTGNFNLTVLDSIPDNFGSYAGDGVGDDWQVQYFGLNNPNAAPGFISDGSGLTNLTKYIGGLTPGDASSRFLLNIAPVPSQPGQKSIAFSPVVAGRTYTLKYKTDLNATTWTPVPGATFIDSGAQRTLTDPNATGSTKFYRIEITKP